MSQAERRPIRKDRDAPESVFSVNFPARFNLSVCKSMNHPVKHPV